MNSQRPDSALLKAEAWLRYFDDLGIHSFYRDRTASIALSNASPALSPGERELSDPVRNARAAAATPVAAEPQISGIPLPISTGDRNQRLPSELQALVHPPSLFESNDPTRNETLEIIRSDLGECTRCKLHRTRHTIVFGTGNSHADLVFVGEGPGHDEDMQGLPFVGRAGKLLNQMIEAMGLQRERVYIANIVKCRPPENRAPQEDEVDACMPFLLRQIAAIGPKVIVCLGSTAAQNLLGTKKSISHFRGHWFDLDGAKVIATYHPAYLLRNPNAKLDVWIDLQKAMAVLGLSPPPRKSPRERD
jgi:uracil-DNA glycosylase family 4